MIYDQVYPMLITLIVEFHVDSILLFNSLAYLQLKLLKKPTLSTAVQNGVACGRFQSVKTVAGDKYAVILGANTAKQVLDAGLLDEILVHSVPILLGDGVRLFTYTGGTQVKLERVGLTQTPQVTNLWFRIKY